MGQSSSSICPPPWALQTWAGKHSACFPAGTLSRVQANVPLGALVMMWARAQGRREGLCPDNAQPGPSPFQQPEPGALFPPISHQRCPTFTPDFFSSAPSQPSISICSNGNNLTYRPPNIQKKKKKSNPGEIPQWAPQNEVPKR